MPGAIAKPAKPTEDFVRKSLRSRLVLGSRLASFICLPPPLLFSCWYDTRSSPVSPLHKCGIPDRRLHLFLAHYLFWCWHGIRHIQPSYAFAHVSLCASFHHADALEDSCGFCALTLDPLRTDHPCPHRDVARVAYQQHKLLSQLTARIESQRVESQFSLFTQTHLNITCRTNVCANVATDTLVIVGVYITAQSGLCFWHTEYCSLRAVNHAVIALETHSAAHTTLAFSDCFFLGQRFDTLFKVTQSSLLVQRNDMTLITRRKFEMTEEQLIMWNNVAI